MTISEAVVHVAKRLDGDPRHLPFARDVLLPALTSNPRAELYLTDLRARCGRAEVIGTKRAAELLSVHHVTILSALNSGEIASVHRGARGPRFIALRALAEWLAREDGEPYRARRTKRKGGQR